MVKEIVLSAFSAALCFFPDLTTHNLYFFFEFSGGNQGPSLSKCYHLLYTVRRHDCYVIFMTDFMHDLFDILVSGLGLFGINYMNIMVFLDLQIVAFYFVCVKYKNHDAFLKSLIITENIHKFSSCRFNIRLCQIFQIIPRKNDIVSVHKQIFLYRFFFFCSVFLYFRRCNRFLGVRLFSLDFSVGTDKYFFQFFRFTGMAFIALCSGFGSGSPGILWISGSLGALFGSFPCSVLCRNLSGHPAFFSLF